MKLAALGVSKVDGYEGFISNTPLNRPHWLIADKGKQVVIDALKLLDWAVNDRDHFAEAGQAEPDSGWTWDDLVRCADKLTIRNKRFGFYFHLFSYNRWPIFLLQSGGDVFRRNKQGNYEVCDENLIKGFSMCRDIVNNSDAYPTMLTASEADAEQLFLQGKVSMIMTSDMGMNELKDADFSYDIAPLPHLADFKTMLVAIGLGLNRKSKVKEAARQFTEFLLSPFAQMAIRQDTLSIPARKSAAEWTGEEREGLQRPKRYQLFREIVPTYRLFTDLHINHKQLLQVCGRPSCIGPGCRTKRHCAAALRKN